MSKIHQALERAERERCAAPAVSHSTVPNRTVEAIAAATANAIDAGAESTSPAPVSFKFENLWSGCTDAGWTLDSNFSAFANGHASSILGEQFRTLRSRLYQIRESQNIRRILVASGSPGEGKTFVATNLAQALARKNGVRVLLIDADLRCSKLHVALGADSTPGLSEFLAGQIGATDILQKGLPEHLCFIPSGSHVTHPADLISNGRLKGLLDQFAEAFDWIIVDSPAAIPLADANILAGLCDGVLFVVRAGLTPAATLQDFRQHFPGRKILGVILNAAEQTQVYGGYYNGYMHRPEKQESRESILPLKQSASKTLFPGNSALDPTEASRKSEQRS